MVMFAIAVLTVYIQHEAVMLQDRNAGPASLLLVTILGASCLATIAFYSLPEDFQGTSLDAACGGVLCTGVCAGHACVRSSTGASDLYYAVCAVSVRFPCKDGTSIESSTAPFRSALTRSDAQGPIIRNPDPRDTLLGKRE
jgi:hypothetical protein